MKVKVTKEALMKALEDFDTSGNRWIKGHYLWPDQIDLEATPIEEKKEECVHDFGMCRNSCGKCGIPHPFATPLPKQKIEELNWLTMSEPKPFRQSTADFYTDLLNKINEIIRSLNSQV